MIDRSVALPGFRLGSRFGLGSRSTGMRFRSRFRLVLALLACLSLPVAAGAQEADSVLVLGRISDNPKEHYPQLKPLLDYVVPRMHDVGITEGRILMARDAQQMNSYLRRGLVDWVTETTGNAMRLQQGSRAHPFLLTERGGVSRYHSIFFVRKNGDIHGLAGLDGHSVAFQRNASTSSYLVPAMTLLDAGLRPEILLSPRDRPSSDTVGYVFAGTEANLSAWVHKRVVDAGVISNLDWEDPRVVPESFKRDFRVIHETEDYPRAVELVGPGMSPKVEARLREVLLHAADDPEGREAMRQFFHTSRFLQIDEASQRALQRIRDGAARVREAIE